ncbi:hypothetical protein SGFS_002630 [Streptomyces graminofaciens]|uniref:Uncharacterized protein n=1 Tax=Streptomyces graminofaciens TaxID=68212 RepID=A0ABM7F0C9_9ACTN|nr:hypothetical protein SGFS_002630 [Streptomyces graminofaciens]
MVGELPPQRRQFPDTKLAPPETTGSANSTLRYRTPPPTTRCVRLNKAWGRVAPGGIEFIKLSYGFPWGPNR